MHLIQIYDPALCCSTGVCGVEVDQSLVTFASDVEWAIRQGANVQRFIWRMSLRPLLSNPLFATSCSVPAKAACL